MLTEREIRLITLYADMIGDHATGLAAQQAVSDTAPTPIGAILPSTPFCANCGRRGIVTLTLKATRHPVAEPRARPVSRVGRCRRSMQPSPHPADAMTQNRRALADIACVALDTDTTSRYSSKHRLVERGAVCFRTRMAGSSLPSKRFINPERPIPQMFNRFTASPIAGPGSTHDRACPPTVHRVLGTPNTMLLANNARFDLSGDRPTMRYHNRLQTRIATTQTTNHDAAPDARGERCRLGNDARPSEPCGEDRGVSADRIHGFGRFMAGG